MTWTTEFPTNENANGEELRELVSKMREIAAPVGPLHAWWDVIFDVEAFLDGKPTILKNSGPEWAIYCKSLLESRGRK